MRIITDRDLEEVPMSVAIEAVRGFFASAKKGLVVTPPRHTVNAGSGGLTFTIGAELEKTKTIGFRVYDTYLGRRGTNSDQLVAVYSTNSSQLKGIVIGSTLGAIRTAAINGFAADVMARQEIDTVCLIGAGHQAYYQIKAILSVRSPKQVIICNRTQSKAEKLVNRLSREHETQFVADNNIKSSVRIADIIVCATSSPTPVIEASWLKDDAYVSSIGPKFKERHELPKDIQSRASLVVSDAPQQLSAYTSGYFLEDVSSIIPLEDAFQDSDNRGYSVFLSTGRSGTEVVVADGLIKYFLMNFDLQNR